MAARMLGKKAPRFDKRTLKFADYLKVSMPPTPSHLHWGLKIPANGWGMALNDSEGDCTLRRRNAHGGAVEQRTSFFADHYS